jgi:hypothetical protein
MSDEFVRVRTSNGYETTLSQAYVDSIKGDVEVLDEPATNSWGRPLPATRRNGRRAKPRTTVKKAAAKKAAARRTSDVQASADTNTGGAAADTPEEGKE